MTDPQAAWRGAAFSVLFLFACPPPSPCAPVPVDVPVLALPARPANAPTGSELARLTAALPAAERQQAFLEELQRGNVPSFLRTFEPLPLHSPLGDVTATVFVLPDYLAVGSDDDYLYVPLDYYGATMAADRLAAVLPTAHIVDAVYADALHPLAPQPLPASPLMRSNRWLTDHQHLIGVQRASLPAGEIMAGHKKDVVLTNRLLTHPGRVAIYGWHRGVGDPIQPLCTAHGAQYADYSHGVRLISTTVLVDGKPRSIYDALADPLLAAALTDEGPLPAAWALMHPQAAGDAHLASVD